jgi:SAM-dependent methyltransferase
MTTDDTPRFGFGKNWQDFVDRHYSEERVQIAQNHLLSFLKMPDLSGKRMIDIGCGSGLHSMAALRANVSELFSFDYDPDSVAATRKLHVLLREPPHWRIEQGSILDEEFLSKLGEFDVVYSWGVLHHTGDQWSAIRNAAKLLATSGVFYVALYTSEVFVDPPAEYWLAVKRRYNRSGWAVKRWMEGGYIVRQLAGVVRAGKNPFTFVMHYKTSRGMSFYTDVKDWLGGWPMEFSSVEEVKRFAGEELGLELINIATGEANTEYLFRRAATA